MGEYRKLRLEQADRVLTVWIDAPPRNFFTLELGAELDELARSLRHDRGVGAVILASADEHAFVTHAWPRELLEGSQGVGRTVPLPLAKGAIAAAGAINRVPRLRDAAERTPARGLLGLRRFGDALRRMNRLDQVVIGAINGTALGAGFELALGCDIRIAAEGDYRVGLVESLFGLSNGSGAAQRMARAVGTAKALELILEGAYLTPREAEERGLVHRVVEPARLLDEARELGERLSRRQPETTGATKRALYGGSTRPFWRAISLEQATYVAVGAGPGAVRALEAFTREIESLGDSGPYPADEVLPRWHAGTAVDLVTRP